MHTESQSSLLPRNIPWNKGRLTGQKRPLKPKDVWAIRVRLQLQNRARDLALFNLAIDSKLRATCEPFNCSSGIRSSKARYATSGSRSTTRSAFPSTSSC